MAQVISHDILNIFHTFGLTGTSAEKFIAIVLKNGIPLVLTIEKISRRNIDFEVIEKYIPKINNRICVDHTNILNSFVIELLENLNCNIKCNTFLKGSGNYKLIIINKKKINTKK
ncbi:hypothetical protein Calkr_0559 [Caldicellulosiruptor acetigenus I77R1B]|uniref:Uncharacterized protein n=1 Tax=Caldicellulosiruptor acetigenus (strain ATCC 700853 / DSM 12137 / I77R1B) TaxID=632335 RepID=E4S9W4_CALA7|nr:hypothetical protein [Caldicellulosiruptor acetigenus]ADQ40105.1 hypothetical protein Calkr_0559 [Caldicellulosiruptor acetigenus I77R1B]